MRLFDQFFSPLFNKKRQNGLNNYRQGGVTPIITEREIVVYFILVLLTSTKMKGTLIDGTKYVPGHCGF